MRHLVAHLRRYLVHDLGMLALDPRAWTELLKVGVFKAGGALTAGLLIPVTALATYSIPVRAIERITAPIMGAAPDIFDVRNLGRLSRARLRDALRAPDTVRRALGGPPDVFDPGSSDQTVEVTDVFAAADPGLFGAGSITDRLAPPEAAPGDPVEPITGGEPTAGEGSGGGYPQGPNDPDPGIDEVVGDTDDDAQDQGDEQGGDSGPAEGQGQAAGDEQGDQGNEGSQDQGDQAGTEDVGNQDSQPGDDQGDSGGDTGQGDANHDGGSSDQGSDEESTGDGQSGNQDDEEDDSDGDQGTGDQGGGNDVPGDDGDDDSDDDDSDHGDDDDDHALGNGNGHGGDDDDDDDDDDDGNGHGDDDDSDSDDSDDSDD